MQDIFTLSLSGMRSAMKNTDKRSIVTGLSLFALALCSFVPMGMAENAAPGGTVSVVEPAPSEPVPNGPGDGAFGEEFPPQPVSVAPAEEATPTAVNEPTPVPAAEGTVSAVSEVTPPVASTTDAPPSEQELITVPQDAQGSVTGTNVMGDSGVEQKHSGTYYDSNALVPDSDLAAAGAVGPRKVDPAYEPGSKFVVVEKGAKASSYEGQFVAATRALKLGRYAAAMEMFEKLYKRNHKDPRVLMGLAVAQQGAGFKESAARTYEDLLKVQPNNADAIVNLMGLMKDQYPSVTLKKLGELRNKYPSNPGIPAQMALINAGQDNYDDAIRYFEVAASMDPQNSSHIYNMAIVADKKGDVSNAIKLYERALQLDASYGDVANSLPREQIYDRLVVLRRKV